MSVEAFSATQRLQLFLPLSCELGGCGLQSARWRREAAFLGSWHLCLGAVAVTLRFTSADQLLAAAERSVRAPLNDAATFTASLASRAPPRVRPRAPPRRLPRPRRQPRQWDLVGSQLRDSQRSCAHHQHIPCIQQLLAMPAVPGQHRMYRLYRTETRAPGRQCLPPHRCSTRGDRRLCPTACCTD